MSNRKIRLIIEVNTQDLQDADDSPGDKAKMLFESFDFRYDAYMDTQKPDDDVTNRKAQWTEVKPTDRKPLAEFKYFSLVFLIPGYMMALGALASLIFLEFGAFFGLALFAAVFISAGRFLKKFFTHGASLQVARLIGSDENNQPIEKIVSISKDLNSAEILASENKLDDEPWTRRDDWMHGEISEIGAYGPLIWIFFLVVLNALCFGIPFGFYLENPDSPDWIVITVSAGMALAGNFILIKRSIHEICYGVSKLRLNDVPVEPGRYLQATLQTGVKAGRFGNKSFEVNLVCASSKTTSYKVAGTSASEQKTRTQTSNYAVWSESRTFQGIRGSNGKYEVKIVFRVPTDQPQTQAAPDSEQIRWLVRAEAKTIGVNYNAEFEIPVFEKNL